MTQEFLTKSVTAGDLNVVASNGTVIKYVVPFWNGLDGSAIPLPPDLPEYWSWQRDIILRSTIHHEAMWAAALGIAVSKMASLAFEVDSAVALRAKRAQELLLKADGRRVGWVGFIAKQLRDFLTTDNGSFFEIVRATSALGSRIVGLRHLDSLRCTRTGDPERPVIFRDRQNRYHVLRDHQVVMLSDMADPSELWYGVGVCAASRAYHAIYKLATIEWYLREKVSGLHPLSIYVVNGMMGQQIEDAVRSAEADKVSRGVTAYMGAVVVGVPKDSPPEVVEIPLATLPDRFDRKQEFDLSVLTYADCIGIDVQDLQPLSGQPLGTGAQSQVLDDKQKGKGLSVWRQDFTHALNEYVLDEMTTFAFIEHDYRDQERSAQVKKAHADVSATRIKAGITTPQQELQILVDYDDLPKEFLPADQTPGDSVSDTDKPEKEDAAQVGAAAAEQVEQGEEKPKPEQDEAETKEAQGDVSKSVMVALFIPPGIARAIAVDDGNDPRDLHITLAYMGENGTESLDRDHLVRVLRSLADETPAVTGVINGRGMFKVGDDAWAHFLTLDSPGLASLRQRIIDALKDSGVEVVENHGFVPHITLTYSQSEEPPDVLLPKCEVKIPDLTLAWGNKRERFPFGGEAFKAADTSLEEAERLMDGAIEKAISRVSKEMTFKHLPGQHNQKRHGWRYGGLDKVRRSLRGQPKNERDEYRKRAGMPEPKKVERIKPGPAGTKVSSRLAVQVTSPKRLGVAIKETLDAIDNVHGDGELPLIPIEKSSGQLTTGEFHARIGRAVKIRVSDKSDTPMMTAAHEMGHFLDHSGDKAALYKLSGTRKFINQPDKFRKAATKVWNNIAGSEAIKDLHATVTKPFVELAMPDGNLVRLRPDGRYISYLLSPVEIWARAYAQYIAVRSGNRSMLAELKRIQGIGGYKTQWSDEDFAPIADAIDELFSEVGWRKK